MDVEVTEASGTTVVRVQGELDLATAPQLDEALGGIEGGGPVIVDLTDVGFLDSSGLAVLLQARQRIGGTDGDGLRLVVSRPAILRVLEVTGLTAVFPVFDTLGDATGAQ
jgi:anti-anti-sigma factor